MSNALSGINKELEFNVRATDKDGDNLTYYANGVPSGANFDPISRYFTWTSTCKSPGKYQVTFSVNDGQGGTHSETITITVRYPLPGKPSNPSPEPNDIYAGNVPINTGLYWADASYATSYDIYFATSRWFESNPGLLIFKDHVSSSCYTELAPLEYNQHYCWKVVAKNPDGSTEGDVWCFTTEEASFNHKSVISHIRGKRAYVGEELEFQVKITDPDEDTLSYSYTNMPLGASFDSTTQYFTWTPLSSQIGEHRITIKVDDGYRCRTS